MSHDYTEDQLVEQPALALLGSMGWSVASALNEGDAANGSLGRTSKGEVVLGSRLRSALEALNPGLPPSAIQNAVDQITADRSGMSLVGANREVYELLKKDSAGDLFGATRGTS